jgi:hypothetical protein
VKSIGYFLEFNWSQFYQLKLIGDFKRGESRDLKGEQNAFKKFQWFYFK